MLEVHGQSITNVIAEQSGNTLIISYSLLTDTPCEITFSVSTDGGISWSVPNKGVSGDAGVNIVQGNRTIRWAVLDAQDQLVSNNVLFKVAAVESFKTVTIGSQLWMAENLNIDEFRNGDKIPEARSSEQWKRAGEKKQPAWCYYDSNSQNGKLYGKLYNWYAVNDPRGLAPAGWHIPNDAEWIQLTDYLGGQQIAGAKMKSLYGWSNGGPGSQNCDFSGLPGGFRNFDGEYTGLAHNCYWWSSSELIGDYALSRSLVNFNDNVIREYFNNRLGFSVRCLRD